MSVKPRTRLGYHFGVNRKDIPTERKGTTGESKFIEGRNRPRMAGEVNLLTAEPDYQRPPIKGLWLKQPTLRLSTPLKQPPGGSPISDETDFF
jgi:hypothetical protein